MNLKLMCGLLVVAACVFGAQALTTMTAAGVTEGVTAAGNTEAAATGAGNTEAAATAGVTQGAPANTNAAAAGTSTPAAAMPTAAPESGQLAELQAELVAVNQAIEGLKHDRMGCKGNKNCRMRDTRKIQHDKHEKKEIQAEIKALE